jgi:hypothetical protein
VHVELIVIAGFLVAFVGVAIAVYSRRGSDISEHPLGQEAAGEAPGAAGRSEISGHDAGESTTFDQHGTR